MKIYFARHGESEANLLHVISNRGLKYGLTSIGRMQAAKLATQLQGHPIARIYSSPLLRAIETSAILAERLKVPYEVVNGLREYDCGLAEGRADAAAWEMWQAEYDAWLYRQDYSIQIEGGESFQDVHQRFVPFIDWLVEAYAGTSIAVVCISHGGILGVMFPLIMKNVTLALIDQYGFDYTSCIIAEYRLAGLVCVEWNGNSIGTG